MSPRQALYMSLVLFPLAGTAFGELQLRDQELPTKLTVGYAVRLLDMNGDQRLDIAIVDSKRFLWLENPNWAEHVLLDTPDQKNDNVCFAPHDIDGDGRLDFAIGADWQPNNTETGGSIGWISPGRSPTDAWSVHAIAEEPTTHRMQFADLSGDGQPELIVAPLKGRNTTAPNFAESGVRLLAYEIPKDPLAGPWQPHVISSELHVVHNFWPTRFLYGGQRPELLVVSFEGVSLLHRSPDGRWNRLHVGTGDQESSPNRGASEIKLGQLAGSAQYIATIEPWHGDKVVVYTRPAAQPPANGEGEWLWKRHVLDTELKWGHAVSCANLDSDADEELIIGVRDDLSDQHRRGLRIYDPSGSGTAWARTIVDAGSVAIEDLAAGDLNGDGRVDIVAVGRQTHNVKIYWNETK